MMNKRLFTSLFAIFFLSFAVSVSAKNDHTNGNKQSGASKRLVLNLVGERVKGVPGMVPLADGTWAEADCFEMDLLDIKTGRKVGTGKDCLMPSQFDVPGVNLLGTGFFTLPQGTLVSQGYTSVRPVRDDGPQTISPAIGTITHITGAASDLNALFPELGTKRFKNRTGTVRLSGMVNMSRLEEYGEISFDCIFVIDLD